MGVKKKTEKIHKVEKEVTCLRLISSVEMNDGRAVLKPHPLSRLCPASFCGRRSSSSSSSLPDWLGAMRKARSLFEETSCVVYRKVLCDDDDVHIFLW